MQLLQIIVIFLILIYHHKTMTFLDIVIGLVIATESECTHALQRIPVTVCAKTFLATQAIWNSSIFYIRHFSLTSDIHWGQEGQCQSLRSFSTWQCCMCWSSRVHSHHSNTESQTHDLACLHMNTKVYTWISWSILTVGSENVLPGRNGKPSIFVYYFGVLYSNI